MAKVGRKRKWTLAKVRAEAKNYKTRKQFEKNSPAYWAAKRHKWLRLIELPRYIWTEEAIRAEASKCRGKGEFREKSRGAYRAALKERMLDDLFPACGKAGA